MEYADSKKSTSKSITDFSVSSLKSKIHYETMKNNLNPSRNLKILGKSNSLNNIKIRIKKDEKLGDRLVATVHTLKRSHSNLKNISDKEEMKNQLISKTLYSLNDELGKTWRENENLRCKLTKKIKEKEKIESKSQDKVIITNKMAVRHRNMNNTLKMVKDTIRLLKINVRDGNKIGDKIAKKIENENKDLIDKINEIKATHDVLMSKIDELYLIREKIKTDIKNDAIIFQEKFKYYKTNSEDLEKKIVEKKNQINHYQINYDNQEIGEKMKCIDKAEKVNSDLKEKIQEFKFKNQELVLKITELKDKICMMEKANREKDKEKRMKKLRFKTNVQIIKNENINKNEEMNSKSITIMNGNIEKKASINHHDNTEQIKKNEMQGN